LAERDAAISATNKRAARMEARLAAAVAERDAAAAAAHERAADMEARLAEVWAEREAAVAAAHERADGMKARLTEALGEREAQLVAARTFQNVIGMLHADLARAEQDIRERATATAALHTELGSLREQLAATRQVGKDLLAALRADILPAIEHIAPAPWWRSLFRVPRLRPADRVSQAAE
jgi:ABC-type transporter Mla subunit MlaD